MSDEMRRALREAVEAASPHLVAAGQELLAAGSAFVAALMSGEEHPSTVVQVDVTSEDT